MLIIKVSASFDNTVRFWNATTGSSVQNLTHVDSFGHVR